MKHFVGGFEPQPLSRPVVQSVLNLGSVTLEATATFDLTANGAGVSPQHAGNLGGGELGSHKALDLVSFFSAEVFVHWATSTWG